jgi:hypothetical protein
MNYPKDGVFSSKKSIRRNAKTLVDELVRWATKPRRP